MKKVDRNEKIRAERRGGETLREIGKKFNISYERVRQICVNIEYKRKNKKQTTIEAYPDREKLCIRCNQIKNLDDFYTTNFRKGNKSAVCKDCSYLKTRVYTYRKYGMTVEDYENMYNRQNGKCCICQNDYTILCVDHNHETGKVRGLLCKVCNTYLGKIKDNVEIAKLMVSYLEKEKIC